MSQSLICFHCGAKLTEDTMHELDDQLMCDDCFEELTTFCDCCLDRIWRAEAEGNRVLTLCHYCLENNYCNCSSCGFLLHNDDARYLDDEDEPYCEDCYNKYSANSIHNYHYKPEPIFYGSSSLFMGVELEIDDGGESDSNAEKICNLANFDEERIYCKHDGSLDDGFEIVSHPMTLDYHTNSMNWREIMAEAIRLHYTSHNAGSCGLHVHCNRDFFGDTLDEQEIAIGRIIFFVEKHWSELVKFSRRTSGSLNRWAAKYATISSTILETYQKAKDKDLGRYVAVNLANYHTIEFRIFRGTLRYETFLATLQLVDEICHLALRLHDYEMEELSWSEFVMRIDKTAKPELIDYLKARRLYVNERVDDGLEV